MNSELEAIADAMDKSTGDGRDREHAVELSQAYVKAHPELTEEMHDWSLEQIVAAMSVFSAAGFREKYMTLEAYHLAKFPPQNIGGEYHVVAQMPDLERQLGGTSHITVHVRHWVGVRIHLRLGSLGDKVGALIRAHTMIWIAHERAHTAGATAVHARVDSVVVVLYATRQNRCRRNIRHT